MLEDPVITNKRTFAYVVNDSMDKSQTSWIAKKNITMNSVYHINGKLDYLFWNSVDSTLQIPGEDWKLGLTSCDQWKFNKENL